MNKLIQLDGVIWKIEGDEYEDKIPIPLCIKHRVRLYPYGNDRYTRQLKCEECKKFIEIPRGLDDEQRYVIDKIDSKEFRQMKVINLDDEAIPLAKDADKDDDYFVTANLIESKVGKRLVVYAGKKSEKDKCQIFIEPDIKRLAFDQNNLHPNDVFLEVKAKFEDGSEASQKTPSKRGE